MNDTARRIVTAVAAFAVAGYLVHQHAELRAVQADCAALRGSVARLYDQYNVHMRDLHVEPLKEELRELKARRPSPPVSAGDVNAEHLRALADESPANLFSKVDTLCRGSNKHPYSLATLQTALHAKGYAVLFVGEPARPALIQLEKPAAAR